MDWIKKNYDRFLLVLAALLLTGFSGVLFLQGVSFKNGLKEESGVSLRSHKLPSLDIVDLERASQQIASPFTWSSRPHPFFVSEKYLVKDNRLVNPLREDGSPIHPPVPNKWFDQNGLDLLDPQVLVQDQDKDGFSNLEEFNAKTDPQSPQSHPEYITKLRLKRIIKKPFRFIFKSWYGNPEQFESLNFQIETIDLKQPTQFVKINGAVQGTNFKVVKFESKTVTDSNQIRKDISELSLQNEEGELIVLPLEKIANFPKLSARFKYLWNGAEFEAKTNEQFSLEPAPDRTYKVIDISLTQALVVDPAGQNVAIPTLEENLP